jgi:hypothetical protein
VETFFISFSVLTWNLAQAADSLAQRENGLGSLFFRNVIASRLLSLGE